MVSFGEMLVEHLTTQLAQNILVGTNVLIENQHRKQDACKFPGRIYWYLLEKLFC